MKLTSSLPETVSALQGRSIDAERLVALEPLVNYLESKLAIDESVHLIFICTHNSRRSQFAQIWAQTAAHYYEIDARCFSGGIEVTSFDSRAITAIRNSGFDVSVAAGQNPMCLVSLSQDIPQIKTFSKLYDDAINPSDGFAAIMTCANAEENCPFIQGAEQRISLPYEDPKVFDGTPKETSKYIERSLQIASEMFYVFNKARK